MTLDRLIVLLVVVFQMAIGSNQVFAQTTQPKTGDIPSTKQWSNNIGDWIVSCAQDAEGKKTCAMAQSLSNANTRQTLAVLSFAKGEADKLFGTVRIPLGVSLVAGVQVTVEGQPAFAVAYRMCLTMGCFGNFEVTSPLLANLRKAGKLSITVQSTQNQPANLNFSMTGFSKALDAYMQEVK